MQGGVEECEDSGPAGLDPVLDEALEGARTCTAGVDSSRYTPGEARRVGINTKRRDMFVEMCVDVDEAGRHNESSSIKHHLS